MKCSRWIGSLAARKAAALILDSGAFLAAERSDRRIAQWLTVAQRNGADVIVPAAVIAEVWRENVAWGAGQLRKSANEVVPLDDDVARVIGSLNRRVKRSQIVDAHVALVAYDRAPAIIVTSDPEDIAVLARATGASVSIGAGQRGRRRDIHVEPI